MSDIIIDSDSGKFKAGDGQDLNLYHNGTNSFIENETGILYVTNKANANMVFGTNNTARITVEADGDIGINETSPTAKLDVDGDIQIKGANALLLNHTTGAASDTYINSPSSNNMGFRTGGTLAMTIDSSQRVGIGTTDNFASPSGSSSGSASQVTIKGSLRLDSEDDDTGSGTEIDSIQFCKAHGLGAGVARYTMAEIRSFTNGGYESGLNFWTSESAGGGGYDITKKMTLTGTGKLGIGTTFGENIASSVSKFAVRSDTTSTHYNMLNIWEHNDTQTGTEQRIGWALGDDGGGEASFGFAGYIGVGKQDAWSVDSSRDSFMTFGVAANNSVAEAMRIESVGGGTGNLMIGRTSSSFNNDGLLINAGSFMYLERSAGTSNSLLYVHRRNGDGQLIDFYESNNYEGGIAVSGSTVAYNGFSGTHDTSGIASDTEIGTVLSTIDEEHKADHAKVKVSDSVGDKRVYGVLQQYVEETTNDDTEKTIPEHAVVASVGIGSVKVTGACAGGDLLESNGDGTAKVQDDDIIRSKTIGKVTIGDSKKSVKLVSCVLYCG